jgi:hypothetical protein
MGKFGDPSEGFADSGGTQLLRVWDDRLCALVSALDAIDADDPFNFCEDARQIWHSAVVADPPPAPSCAMLVVLDVLQALAHETASATMAYYSTPDTLDRLTLSAVHTSLGRRLTDVKDECERWLAEGLPPADAVKTRSATVLASLKDVTESSDRSDNDSALDIGILFDRACLLTEAENRRYREAYDRLRTMLDKELLQHICDQHDELTGVVHAIAGDLQAERISLLDEDATDECERKIRSALISFTSALQIHQAQTIKTAIRIFGHDSTAAQAVRDLFADLKRSSFGYRWLEILRTSFENGAVDACWYEFTPRRHGESEVNVRMDRKAMLRFTPQTKAKGLTATELDAMRTDPSVLDMVTAVHPKITALQGQLDAIMYPNVAADVAVIEEMIGRFDNGRGVDVLRSRQDCIGELGSALPYPRLAPRVLAFVKGYREAHHS